MGAEATDAEASGRAEWADLLDAGFFLGSDCCGGDHLASTALPRDATRPELADFLAEWMTGDGARHALAQVAGGRGRGGGDPEPEELDGDPAGVCATDSMAVSVRDSDAVPVLRADADALAGSGVATGLTLDVSAIMGWTRVGTLGSDSRGGRDRDRDNANGTGRETWGKGTHRNRLLQTGFP